MTARCCKVGEKRKSSEGEQVCNCFLHVSVLNNFIIYCDCIHTPIILVSFFPTSHGGGERGRFLFILIKAVHMSTGGGLLTVTQVMSKRLPD